MKRTSILAVALLCIAVGMIAVWQLNRVPDAQVDPEPTPAGAPVEQSPQANELEKPGISPARVEIQHPAQTYTISLIDLDEEPVGECELILGTEPSTLRVRTDAKGLCNFAPPAHDGQGLEVRTADPDLLLADLLNRRHIQTLQLPEEPTDHIQLRINRLRHLSGRVVDEQGAGVAGAEILLPLDAANFPTGPQSPHLRPDGRRRQLIGTEKSDAEGRFSLRVPEATRVSGVQARIAPKLASEIHDMEPWKQNANHQFELRLLRLAGIRGQLRTAGMDPPELVSLTLQRKLTGAGTYAPILNQHPVMLTRPPSAYPFEFVYLLPGDYQLESRHGSRRNPKSSQEFTRLRLLPGETKDLVVTLRPTPQSQWDITGTVVDERGKAIESMSITATLAGNSVLREWSTMPQRPFHASTMSDAQGRFVIHAQQGQQLLLKTRQVAKRTPPFTYHPVVEQQVEAGQKDLRLVVQSRDAGIVQGKFVFPDGKIPSPFPFRFYWFGSPRTWRSPDKKHATFTIKHVPPGPHKIGVDCGAYPPLSKTIQVVAGRTTPVLLEFGSLEVLRGQVVDAKSRPIAGAKIWLNVGYRPGLGKSPQAVTNKAGWFELPGFRPGGSFVLVLKDGFAHYSKVIKDPNDPRETRLVLYKEATAYIRHLPLTGKPFGLKFDKATFYWITVLYVDPVTAEQRDVKSVGYSPERPYTSLENVPAGDYKVLIQVLPPKWDRKKKPPFVWRRMSIPAGKTTSLDWRKLKESR